MTTNTKITPASHPVVTACAGSQDLLPWSAPHVSQMLARRRLQAALNDSLAFVSQDHREPRQHVSRAG